MDAKEPEKAAIAVDDYESWNELLNSNQISESFRKGLNQFAYKSASAVLKDTSENGNYSPLSLYYALALAGCGSKGETSEQIFKNLGVQNREELAGQCQKLYQWYVYQSQWEKERMEEYGMKDYRSTILLGNSLWLSDRLEIYEEYQKLAADKFFASSYVVDFTNPDTGNQMGEWISKKTNGVLKPQMNVESSTLLTIINTLYFYGGWTDPFYEEMTKEDLFILEDQSQVMVPYLNRTEMMGAFKKEEGYTISFLGTDNNCRMVFLLPDKGRTVNEFLENEDKLKEVMEVGEGSWSRGEIVWKVPKFDFGSSYKLNETLKAMGMERMFDSSAEFEDISPLSLLVSSVIQETHIGVDENGVEGAAFSAIAMAEGAAIGQKETVSMILDRPFLFGIQDSVHGTWLFLGVCRNPADKG